MSEEERNRILTVLFAKDSALFAARQQVNQLRLSLNLSAQEYNQARERIEDLQDEITVRIDMVIDDIPIIQPPTQEQVDVLTTNIQSLEQQIAASAAVDDLLTIAGEAVAMAAA